MPSQKGLEQALTWFKSKMADENPLEAINAEVCYNVIMDLREKRKVIGALLSPELHGEKRYAGKTSGTGASASSGEYTKGVLS